MDINTLNALHAEGLIDERQQSLLSCIRSSLHLIRLENHSRAEEENSEVAEQVGVGKNSYE